MAEISNYTIGYLKGKDSMRLYKVIFQKNSEGIVSQILDETKKINKK